MCRRTCAGLRSDVPSGKGSRRTKVRLCALETAEGVVWSAFLENDNGVGVGAWLEGAHQLKVKKKSLGPITICRPLPSDLDRPSVFTDGMLASILREKKSTAPPRRVPSLGMPGRPQQS